MLQISDKQLQRKFKHAIDFGIVGNYNQENVARYHQALLAHVNDSNTQFVEGTYHKNHVLHYFNPITRINVIFDMDGNFVSGWQLSPDQFQNLINRGAL
jgi:hypothetical protein